MGIVAMLAACASAAPAPPPQPQPPERATSTAESESESKPQYLPVVRTALADGRYLLLTNGTRFERSGPGRFRAARQQPARPVYRVDPIPEYLGGGYLFATGAGLYRSKTFLGDLKGFPQPPRLERISFGPSFALIHQHRYARFAFSLTDNTYLERLPLPGMVEVAALGDGRAIAILRPRALWVTTDGGENWTDESRRLGPGELSVGRAAGEVWVLMGASTCLTLTEQGQLVPRTPPDQEPKEDSEPHLTEQLVGVATMGVPLDDDAVLIRTKDGLQRLELRTGRTRRFDFEVPDGYDCRPLDVPGEALLHCVKPSQEQFIVDPRWAPRVRHRFGTHAKRIFVGDRGALAIPSRCPRADGAPGEVVRSAVCVRRSDGEWVEHDLEDVLARAGLTGLAIWRWIPDGDGNAVAVVGPSARKLVATRTRSVRTLSSRASRLLAHVPGGSLAKRNWMLAKGGRLKGWSLEGSVSVDRAGDVQSTQPQLTGVAHHGPYGLGLDARQQWWQTEDFGDHWVQVQEPPPGARLRECSAVGCDLKGWFRVGWRATPPAEGPASAAQRIAPPPPHWEPVGLPSLVCHRTGEFRKSKRDHPLAFQRGRQKDLTCIVDGIAAVKNEYWSVGSPQHDSTGQLPPPGMTMPLWHVAPFDPKGRVHHATATYRAFTHHFSGEAYAGNEEEWDGSIENFGECVGRARALFVLGVRPGSADGVFVAEPHFAVWLQPGHPRARVRASFDRYDGLPLGAVALASGDLVLLGRSPKQVRVVSTGERLWGHFELEFGKFADAWIDPITLGVDAHGRLGVVRAPSGASPPSIADPAIVTLRSREEIRLAPWSTLRPANAPECSDRAAGFRMIFRTDRDWLPLRLPAPPQDIPGQSETEQAYQSTLWTMLRWSPDRVCLEALASCSGPSCVVARYTDPTGAAEIVLPDYPYDDTGFDPIWRQDLECTLAP